MVFDSALLERCHGFVTADLSVVEQEPDPVRALKKLLSQMVAANALNMKSAGRCRATHNALVEEIEVRLRTLEERGP